METTHTSQQQMAWLKLLEDKGMTTKRFTTLLASGVLADAVDSNADLTNREAVRLALKLGPAMSEVFHLTVDYGHSLEQMIAAGHHDWKDDDITAKHFPIQEKGEVKFEARYFHFNRGVSSENAIKEIETADTANLWMPAKIEHVLSHGATFPDEQRKFPIFALGSVAEVRDRRSVPYLSRRGSRRVLGLSSFGGGCGPGCRLLAIRKLSTTQVMDLY